MRNRKLVWAVAAASTLAVLGGVAVARAGWKYTTNTVTIDLTNHTAYGQLGAVRNSPDNTASIGCYHEGWDYGTNTSREQVRCYATNAAGQTVSCVDAYNTSSLPQTLPGGAGYNTWLPATITTSYALNGDSYVTFSWDPTYGYCSYIRVENMSWHAPKQL